MKTKAKIERRELDELIVEAAHELSSKQVDKAGEFAMDLNLRIEDERLNVAQVILIIGFMVDVLNKKLTADEPS